jgi:hypothetical protein
MATYNKFQSFVEAVAEKKHDLGADTLKVTFCAAANAPVATNTVLANLTQITLTYVDSQTLTISSSSQTSGTYKLVLADKVVTATGGAVGPFRYAVIYNDTAANDELICWFDYGSEITLADTETLTLDFNATNGVLQLA